MNLNQRMRTLVGLGILFSKLTDWLIHRILDWAEYMPLEKVPFWRVIMIGACAIIVTLTMLLVSHVMHARAEVTQVIFVVQCYMWGWLWVSLLRLLRKKGMRTERERNIVKWSEKPPRK